MSVSGIDAESDEGVKKIDHLKLTENFKLTKWKIPINLIDSIKEHRPGEFFHESNNLQKPSEIP